MKNIFGLILLFNCWFAFAQSDEESIDLPTNDFQFFSDAIANNIRLYKVNSKVANEKKDTERAQFLFDSLVNNCLKGTHFDNFVINDYKSGQTRYMESFTKPIYLKTTATWCEPNDSEVQALNDIADEFGDVIDFVVLYWDERSNIERSQKSYSNNVSIVYVDELENYNSAIINTVKHSLGMPSVILMNGDRTIIDINKNVSPIFTSEKESSYVKYGEFNPTTTKEHFVNTYNTYFDAIVKDVNTILQNI